MEKRFWRTIQIKKEPGVYKITNIKTGNIYIGSSYNMRTRINRHINDLLRQEHHSRYLQRSFNKHGLDNFIFETILTCPVQELIQLEQYLIDFYQPKYNMSKMANGSSGVKRTAEYIQHQKTIKSKPVVQINMITMAIINSYPSALIAGQSIGRSASSVAKCARGFQKQAHGYFWKYI